MDMAGREAAWPFGQSRDCAVFTLRRILEGLAPILHVAHDLDDHGWQFLGLEDAVEEEAQIISFKGIVSLDPSILFLADLPSWMACVAVGAWRTVAARAQSSRRGGMIVNMRIALS